MKVGHYFGRSARALAGVAVLAASASTAALAGDVYWSVGVSVPGVHAGGSGPQPVYVPAQPYYRHAQPVYPQPQVIYTQPQVIHAPPQVIYLQPQVIYSQPQVIYSQPQVIYSQPRPVYVQPRPVYYNGWQHPNRHPHPGWQQGQPRHEQHETPAPRRGHQAVQPQVQGDYYSHRSDRG